MNVECVGRCMVERDDVIAGCGPRDRRRRDEYDREVVMAELKVRRARPRDAALLATLGSETFRESYADDLDGDLLAAYTSEVFGEAQQAAELAEAGSVFLVAESEGEAVGYARLVDGPSPAEVGMEATMELQRIYVRKKWIGRGIGAALMRACLAAAKEAGCESLWLGVWERNTRAIGFYRKWGFGIVGEQPFVMGGDAQRDLLMRRTVDEG